MKEFEAIIAKTWATFMADASGMIANITYAVGVLILGWMVSSFLEGRLKAHFRKKALLVDTTLGLFLASLIRYAIMAVALVSALIRTGIETTSLLAVLGAAGLAIGLALQGTLSNIAAGVMLLLLRPIRFGETIEVSGHTGVVRALGLFTTELKRHDGVYISIPNAQLWGREIINYDRNGTRRLSVVIGVGQGSDLDEVRHHAEVAIQGVAGLLHDPAPDIRLRAFTENGLVIEVRAWVPAADFSRLQSEVRRAVRAALLGAGVDLNVSSKSVSQAANEGVRT